jgi:hypothetical protein|nr:hypothetical protein 11 [bacterium]
MKGSPLPGAVDCAMQRLLDAAQARKSGHGNRPSFLSWDDGTRPGMPPDQKRLEVRELMRRDALEDKSKPAALKP